MADINNPPAPMETYNDRAEIQNVGCFARLFRRGPQEIPLSPTTRNIANSENGADGRQSIPIRPLRVTALIHRDSIQTESNEASGSSSISFTMDCSVATLVRLFTKRKRLLASTEIVEPLFGMTVRLPLEAGWVRAGECGMFLVTQPSVQSEKIEPYIKSAVKLQKRASDGSLTVSIEEQYLCIGDREYEVQEIYGQATNDMIQSEVMMRDVGHSCVSICIHEQQEKLDCVVCLSDVRDTLFLPCRHLCICANCAEPLVHGDGKCPICRQSFESIVTLREETSKGAAEMKEIGLANQAEPNCKK